MTDKQVGDFYEDKHDAFQGGYYLLLSYDYNKCYSRYVWQAVWFPFCRAGNFKGGCMKVLLDEDINRLEFISNLRLLLYTLV